MLNDADVLKLLWPNKISLLKRYINSNKNINDYISYLNNRYKDSSCIEESLYRIKHNIEYKPVCPVCGNELEFVNIKGGHYKKICGYKCSNSNPEKILKTKSSVQNKYGVDNVFQLESIKNKIIENNLKKYNVKYSSQRNDVKEKIIETWKSHDKEFNDKIQVKTKQTRKLKYGDENYGLFGSKAYKDNIYNIYKVTNIAKHPSIRKKLSEKLSSPNVQEKINNTKRKNHTFNVSTPENESYNLLKENFSNVKQQHKSEEYPFLCDFYIPSLDLYIECNYHWTHGGHPYNENDENDKLIVDQWKNKNTLFYNNAINIWTVRDVNKRNIAKQNNLNYKEFWSILELNKWLENYAI